MKPIKLFWCRGRGRTDSAYQNFGDYLSANVVEVASGRPVVHAGIKDADMIAIGSVLNREKKAKSWGFPRKLHIWGTGSGSADDTFSGRHYYHAVRGHSCLKQINNLSASPALGDPGLLASMVVKKSTRKTARIGLIPHISHQGSSEIRALQSLVPGVKIINVFSPVKQVLEEISSCDFVLSSSLHGLIVADSYGVPNQWLSMKRDAGWEYKFRDYYSSFGLMDPTPVSPAQILMDRQWSEESIAEGYLRPGLGDIQEGLLKAFPKF
ncbi:polysaccharide pyruvyl transferase family protein [Pseudomonas putida]|uniref:Polysaccharide pyruvyl transferase family protein n=1 Tax=Pseudomonas putida TaxID=303 RepID=A0A8I1JHF4_PSEPU|nr:polysaccharide pyruvyl transferase family protein [Pseudomonas putida]MBI6882621.1 polysaccharide pyruvyl transferase family protein [Pseudomonas putida]